MSLDQIKISKYENTYSTSNVEVALLSELELIKSGFYKNQILPCREFVVTGDIEAYKMAKKSLPALTFSGTFNGAHKKDNLNIYSKLIIIDLDNITSGINEIKKTLMNDKYLISAWISPSGKGIKALLEIDGDPTNHKNAFDQILFYFKNKYQLDVDKTGSDLCRLCYVSYDPELEIKNNYQPFEFKQEAIESALIDNSNKAPTIFYSSSEQRINSSYSKRLFVKIHKYLNARKLSITEDYDDWYRVALAIANSFNPDVGKRYFLQISSLDKNYDEYKCLELLDYCYRHKRDGAISFRTIVYLAKAKGFNE